MNGRPTSLENIVTGRQCLSSAPDEEECAGTLQVLPCVTQLEVAIDRCSRPVVQIILSEGSGEFGIVFIMGGMHK